MDDLEGSGWFAVRCLFRFNWPLHAATDTSHRYEERITLWRAASAAEAIVMAEAEAETYATAIEEAPSEYLGLAQSYALLDDPSREGAEVFSLIRDSALSADDYLDAFFDTGTEHQPRNDHSGAAEG